MSENWTGWHFLPTDGKLRFGDGREPKDGQKISAKGKLEIARNGLHASEDIMDAIDYSGGPILCRVELHGKRIDTIDKSVGRTRVILWRVDATELMRKFACWSADRAVRVHAVEALRATRNRLCTELARELAELPEITDEVTLLDAETNLRAVYETVCAEKATKKKRAQKSKTAKHEHNRYRLLEYVLDTVGDATLHATTSCTCLSCRVRYAGHAARASRRAAAEATWCKSGNYSGDGKQISAHDAVGTKARKAEKDRQRAKLLELIEEARK